MADIDDQIEELGQSIQNTLTAQKLKTPGGVDVERTSLSEQMKYAEYLERKKSTDNCGGVRFATGRYRRG